MGEGGWVSREIRRFELRLLELFVDFVRRVFGIVLLLYLCVQNRARRLPNISISNCMAEFSGLFLSSWLKAYGFRAQGFGLWLSGSGQCVHTPLSPSAAIARE